MACIINASAGSAPLLLTLVSPSVNFEALFPAADGCEVIVTEGAPDTVILQYKMEFDPSYELLATLVDLGGGHWAGNYEFPVAGTFVLRFKATRGGIEYYSDTVTASIIEPVDVVISDPADSFTIAVGSDFNAEIYVPEGTVVTSAYLDTYADGSYESSFELSFTGSSGGNDYYGATATAPGTNSVGSVVGRVVVDGYEFSASHSGVWAVM